MKYAIDYFSAKANLRSKLSAACRSQKPQRDSAKANLRSKLSAACRSQKLVRHSPSRHCEERSDAVIHEHCSTRAWIATASGLAMTVSKY